MTAKEYQVRSSCPHASACMQLQSAPLLRESPADATKMLVSTLLPFTCRPAAGVQWRRHRWDENLPFDLLRWERKCGKARSPFFKPFIKPWLISRCC